MLPARMTSATPSRGGAVHHRQLGVQARVDEEHRHQHHQSEGLELALHFTGQKTSGHGRAQDEAAEDGMQTRGIHGPGAEHEQHQHHAEKGGREPALTLDPFGQRRQQAAADGQHEDSEHAAADNGLEGDFSAAAEAGQDQRQNGPGAGVVNGAGRQGHGAERRLGQTPLLNDARQNGKGGDGDRRAEEQQRLQGIHALPEQLHVHKPGRQCYGDEEGGQHAGQGHRRRAAGVGLEVIAPEIEADNEHVQADAQLGADKQDAARVLREDHVLHFGRDQSQQGRPEQDACDDFAHHLRLVEQSLHQPAHRPTGRDNDGHLKEEGHAQLSRTHLGTHPQRRPLVRSVRLPPER